MEFKDIIQTNATIIAGVLVLLGISAVVAHVYVVSIIAVSILVLSSSIVLSVFGSSIEESPEDKRKGSLRTIKKYAHAMLIAGVAYVSGAILITVLTLPPH